MKFNPKYIISGLILLLYSINSFAQCRDHIQYQGNNNAIDITLTFNDGNDIPLETCNCQIAGNSGNINCPKSCGFIVPGTGYLTITFSDGSGNNCLYDNNGNLITPLPIELVSFDAKIYTNNVQLKWQTAAELNNDYFTIEKTKDFVTFEIAGVVKGSGNSTSMKNYLLTDSHPFDGVSYYRLKQTDYNGKFSYSDYRIVNYVSGEDLSFNIYPNPATPEKVNCIIKAGKEEEVYIEIFDFTGSKIYSNNLLTVEAGENVFAIEKAELFSSGVYLITAKTAETIITKKLIIN